MVDPREEPVYAALADLDIPYTRFEHLPVMTMDDCNRVDAGRGAVHFKNLFLCNRQQTEFYLLCLMEGKAFVTREISRQIGSSRLSFGNADNLHKVLGITPGAVTPLALINDPLGRVTVLFDRDILSEENCIVHPLVNTASVVMRVAD